MGVLIIKGTIEKFGFLHRLRKLRRRTNRGVPMDQPISKRRGNAALKKWILIAAAVLLIGASCIAVFGYLLPYSSAQSAMPEAGEMTIRQQEDGSLLLSWPAADRADYYCIEIYRPADSEEEAAELVYRDFAREQTSCLLPQLPDTMELTLQIRSVVEYRTMTENCVRYGDNPLAVTTTFRVPEVRELRWSADPDANTLDIACTLQEGDHSFCYLLDENGDVVDTHYLENGRLHLTFGEEGDYPIPDHDDAYHLVFDACWEIPGLKFYGYRSGSMTVVRDHLLGRALTVKCIDRGYNVCTLSWNETKGDAYQVQMLDDNNKQWVTVCEIPADGELTYTSGHLPVFSQVTYRVVAVGGQVMEGSEYAAISDEVVFSTRQSPVYATVWPVKNLTAYRDSDRSETAGTALCGAAYCVLEETGGLFAVMLDGEKVYIDSDYCMINLPEYMGNLCNYDITNSYSSRYMVHEFAIPDVTGVVTAGYENVNLYNNGYLVPLLYPTAEKLVDAALTAASQGYRLKIYDAFRPYRATREIYDLTESILDEELPAKTYTGVSISSLSLPAAQSVTLPDGETKTTRTYRMVMTGGGYSLGAFLAKSGSMHNLGVALDLTLEDLSTGAELQMQTSMHDLSWYSVLSRNNDAANTLAEIMKEAGFGDLVSEWWHFQDDASRNTLALANVRNGVSAECWMADDHGWRYRSVYGSYYKDETVRIGGETYTFDADGYLIENHT